MEGWTHALLVVATLAPGARVLDVACGTGVVTRQAARRVGAGGHVVGVDFNASMLAVARTFPQPPAAAVSFSAPVRFNQIGLNPTSTLPGAISLVETVLMKEYCHVSFISRLYSPIHGLKRCF
jgi:SAM-dependent methyltransferase